MAAFIFMWYQAAKFVGLTAWAEAGEGYVTFEAARDGWGDEDCNVQNAVHNSDGKPFNNVALWLPCEPPAGRRTVFSGPLVAANEMTLSASSSLAKAADAQTVIAIPEGVRIYGPHAQLIVSSAFGVVVVVNGGDGKMVGRNAKAVQLMDDEEEWEVGRDIGPTRPITLMLLYALVLWLSVTIPDREVQWLLGVVVVRFTAVTCGRPAQLRRIRNLREESGVLTLSKNDYGWIEGVKYAAGAVAVVVLVYEQHAAEKVYLWAISITSALVDLVTTKLVSDTRYWTNSLMIVLIGVLSLLTSWAVLPLFYTAPIAQVAVTAVGVILGVASSCTTSEDFKAKLFLCSGCSGCFYIVGLICESIYLWDGYWSYSLYRLYEDLKEPVLSILYCSQAICGAAFTSMVAVVVAYLLVVTSSPNVGHAVSAFKERKTAHGFGHFRESGYSSRHVVAYVSTGSGGIVHTAQLTAPVSTVRTLPVFGWWGRAKAH